MKIRPVEAELFHADRLTDKRGTNDDGTVRVAFRNLANLCTWYPT